MSRKRLIVNADDFGWTQGISDGILLAHREGIVTSASLMVNQPASEYALRQARKYPELGVGIHLNLCEGMPVLPRHEVPTLVRTDGTFYPAEEATRRLWRWQMSGREIETEFRAQIRWMKYRGAFPTHADSHHHLHVYPCAAIAFRRALLAEGIHRARSYRLRSWPKNGSNRVPHGGPLYRRLLIALYVELIQFLFYRRIRHPDYGVEAEQRYRRHGGQLGDGWRMAFGHLPEGTFVLCCHPGYSEPGFSETDPIRDLREVELEALTKRELPFDLDRNGIELINYANL